MNRPALTALSIRAVSEEAANQFTHAVGLVLSMVGAVALLEAAWSGGDSRQVLGCGIYSGTLVALYAASTLSHSFERPKLRHAFRTLDQACIFLLIAGNFTPFALTYLREGWWPSLLIVVWALALVGISLKVLVTRLQNVTTLFYVLLGWLPIIAVKQMFECVHALGLAWILAGGLFYTIGTLFLAQDKRVPYFHAVWHLFVIAGSISHYIVILFFVVLRSQ